MSFDLQRDLCSLGSNHSADNDELELDGPVEQDWPVDIYLNTLPNQHGPVAGEP